MGFVPKERTIGKLFCSQPLFYLSVNVFSTNELIGYTIFTSPTRDGTTILRWSSKPREGLVACSVKGVPSFLSYFKTLINGTRGPVKRSRDLPLRHASALPTELILPNLTDNLLKRLAVAHLGKL